MLCAKHGGFMSDQQDLFKEWYEMREAVERTRRALQAAKEMMHPALIAAMETNHRAALLAYSSVVEKLNA
jgi:hypothetical protein